MPSTALDAKRDARPGRRPRGACALAKLPRVPPAPSRTAGASAMARQHEAGERAGVARGGHDGAEVGHAHRDRDARAEERGVCAGGAAAARAERPPARARGGAARGAPGGRQRWRWGAWALAPGGGGKDAVGGGDGDARGRAPFAESVRTRSWRHARGRHDTESRGPAHHRHDIERAHHDRRAVAVRVVRESSRRSRRGRSRGRRAERPVSTPEPRARACARARARSSRRAASGVPARARRARRARARARARARLSEGARRAGPVSAGARRGARELTGRRSPGRRTRTRRCRPT